MLHCNMQLVGQASYAFVVQSSFNRYALRERCIPAPSKSGITGGR